MTFNEMRFSKKGMGAGTIALFGILVISTLLVEAIYTGNKFAESNVYKRIDRETKVIETINAMEYFKMFMEDEVEDSVVRASYDVLSRGGYNSIPEDVESLNCKPYWRIHSESIDADMLTNDMIEQSIESAAATVFGCYEKMYSDAYNAYGISADTPSYSTCGNVDITSAGGQEFDIIISSECESGLEVSRDFVIVKESNADFEGEAEINAFELIEKAKEKFLDGSERPVLEKVENATSGADCQSKKYEETNGCKYDSDDYKNDDGTWNIGSVGQRLLSETCSDWESGLINEIRSNIADIEIDELEVSFSIADEEYATEFEVTDCDEICHIYETINTGKYECQGGEPPAEEPEEPVEESEEEETTPLPINPDIIMLCQPEGSYCNSEACYDGDVWCKDSCGDLEGKKTECGSDACYDGVCCSPNTCSDIGHTCGTWSDGCGGTVNCGGCDDVGDVCISGVCCNPKTRSDFEHTCGSWDDGCGGEVVYDSCDSGYSCQERKIKKYRTSCEYSYKADVDVVVSVKSESDLEYPIYNSVFGRLEWIKPELKFRIIDGNIDVDLRSLFAETEDCQEISYC